MKNSLRKTLIWVVSVLMLLSVSLSATFTIQKQVKAANELVITNVTQVYMETYNSAADGLGQRGEYVITFNQNIFNDSTAIGADVTADFATMLDTVKVNGTKMNAHIKDSDRTSAFNVYKYSNNAIRVMNDRCILYAEFNFPAGLTLNGYTTAEAVTWYQNSDWTFDTTADNYMIKGVYEVPDGSQNTAAHVCVFTNKADAVDNRAQLNKILLNGQPLFDANGVANTALVVDTYGNDWDTGTSQYQFRVKINYTALGGGYAELTFKSGFSLGTYTLTEDQTFVRTYGKGIENPGWDNEPIWVEKGNQIEVAEIKRLTNASGSDYSIKFNYSSDLLVNYAVGADMTSWFNSEASEMFDNLRIDNTPLYSLASKVTITKLAENIIKLSYAEQTASTTIMIQKGLRIGGAMIFETASYIEGANGTFIKFDTSSANKQEVGVLDMTYAANYGIQSLTRSNTVYYTEKKLETRVTIYFEDLGMFNDTPAGTDISIYCTDPTFTDNVTINGATLTALATNNDLIIKIYKGAKGDYYINNAKEDISKAIEIVIERAALFDYDVEVKEGCILGDVMVEEDVEYRLNFNQEFVKETPSSTVKPISIREIPYGADGNKSRAIRVIFNESAKLASDVNVVDYMTFNGNAISSADDSYIKVTGGQYFNPEVEFNSRYYSLNLEKEAYTNFLVSDNATITVSAMPLANGGSTEAVTFKMKNGQFTPTTDTAEYKKPELAAVKHDANQDIVNDLKIFGFEFNMGLNHYLADYFMSNNLYINGAKAYSMTTSSRYVNVEDSWEAKRFTIYLHNDLRNYEGGIDVIYLAKGMPVGGGLIVPEDTYFYGVQDKNARDGAGNWKWTFSTQKPALKILKGGSVDVGENVVMNITFDRVVAKNDVKFGVYNPVDVTEFIKVNGSALSAISGASYSWSEDGKSIAITVPKTATTGNVATVTFADGFVTPLGYEFAEDTNYQYSFSDKIWGDDLSSLDPNRVAKTTITEVSDLIKINGGYKVIFTFNSDIAGAVKVTGTTSSNYYTWLRNITAEYADLIKMTDYSYASKDGFYGYEYHDEVVKNLYRYGVRQSILDNLFINNVSVGNILANETNMVASQNYPLQVDLNGKNVEIYIYEDSAIYSQVKDGLQIKFQGAVRDDDNITFGIRYETGKYQAEDQIYQLLNGKFSEAGASSLVNGIAVSTEKREYTVGEDLDLSSLKLQYVYLDGSKGEEITVTADMISGYDKTTAGRQKVTITYGEYSTNLFITVKAAPENNTSTNQKKGCRSSLESTALVTVGALTLCGIIVVLRKKSKHD